MEGTEDNLLTQLQAFERFVKRHESVIHTHFSGTPAERCDQVLNYYQRRAAELTASRKTILEDSSVYMRSIIMIAEMVGNAGTHREKNTLLAGLISHLNAQVDKLRREQTEHILDNWELFTWGGMSDYPYREILRKFDVLKQENEQLKAKLKQDDPGNCDELPY